MLVGAPLLLVLAAQTQLWTPEEDDCAAAAVAEACRPACTAGVSLACNVLRADEVAYAKCRDGDTTLCMDRCLRGNLAWACRAVGLGPRRSFAKNGRCLSSLDMDACATACAAGSKASCRMRELEAQASAACRADPGSCRAACDRWGWPRACAAAGVTLEWVPALPPRAPTPSAPAGVQPGATTTTAPPPPPPPPPARRTQWETADCFKGRIGAACDEHCNSEGDAKACKALPAARLASCKRGELDQCRAACGADSRSAACHLVAGRDGEACRGGDVDACRRACALGDARACGLREQLDARACVRGDLTTCARLCDAGVDAGRARACAKAKELRIAACSTGDDVACDAVCLARSAGDEDQRGCRARLTRRVKRCRDGDIEACKLACRPPDATIQDSSTCGRWLDAAAGECRMQLHAPRACDEACLLGDGFSCKLSTLPTPTSACVAGERAACAAICAAGHEPACARMREMDAAVAAFIAAGHAACARPEVHEGSCLDRAWQVRSGSARGEQPQRAPNAAAADAMLGARCDAGGARACRDLASATRDRRAAVDILLRGYRIDSGGVEDIVSRIDALDAKAARSTLEALCDLPALEAARAAGTHAGSRARGEVVRPLPVKDEHGAACRALGASLLDGRYGVRDRARGLEALSGACMNAGDMEACVAWLDGVEWRGGGSDASRVRAGWMCLIVDRGPDVAAACRRAVARGAAPKGR